MYRRFLHYGFNQLGAPVIAKQLKNYLVKPQKCSAPSYIASPTIVSPTVTKASSEKSGFSMCP